MGLGFTYLASPYSHRDPAVIEARYERVAREAAKLMVAGENIFCPITHSHPISKHTPNNNNTHSFWISQDIAILRHATMMKVLMMPGWDKSQGIAQEIAFCRQAGIPIQFIKDDET